MRESRTLDYRRGFNIFVLPAAVRITVEPAALHEASLNCVLRSASRARSASSSQARSGIAYYSNQLLNVFMESPRGGLAACSSERCWHVFGADFMMPDVLPSLSACEPDSCRMQKSDVPYVPSSVAVTWPPLAPSFPFAAAALSAFAAAASAAASRTQI